MSDATAIESAIGLSFHDQALLWQALTRPTYARYLGTPEAHNEWLAVFGDALLDLIVLEFLYGMYGNRSGKGFLSSERDRLVRDVHLEQLAARIRLSELIRVTSENDQISPKEMTNAFESLLAAVYLDQGLETAQNWYISHFLNASQPQPKRQQAIYHSLPTIDLAAVETAINCTFSDKALHSDYGTFLCCSMAKA